MTKSIKQLRRQAKTLKKAYESGEIHARQRIDSFLSRPSGTDLKHADYLHVIAREKSFKSWPDLKHSVQLLGMDVAAKRQRLKIAVHYGQKKVIEQLLAHTPDIAVGDLGLEIALYRRDAVENALAKTPFLAKQDIGSHPPLVHLAQSRVFRCWPERAQDMVSIADLLIKSGADIDLGLPVVQKGSNHLLSPLYFAISHADNMVLARWLLEHGANPNDNESLYHSTELGHHEGLRMLLEHGADPRGTNALLRAMDFHDLKAVRMLLDAGALVDEFDETVIGGERPYVEPALHQAARRMCGKEMIELLLGAGADPKCTFEGCSVYGYARVFGNEVLSRTIEAHGSQVELTREEVLLAKAADGKASPGIYINPESLPDAYRNIIRTILHLPGKLDHVKHLVALGVEYDRPDAEGLTPVHVAGWEGLPEVMAYLLSIKPDLSHVNGFGGTLLSTIIHGSENCPARKDRDYMACLELALREGVALPRRASEMAGEETVAEFLANWAMDHPGQVVEGGVV